jgi:hypothetical protein
MRACSTAGSLWPAYLTLDSQVHEFLNQFEDGAGYVKQESPAFGLRWITWLTNTFCAAVAWRNYPPEEGTAATVRNAVANLDQVRALKAAARDGRFAAQHERALERARRRAEVASSRSDPLARTKLSDVTPPHLVDDPPHGDLAVAPTGDVKVPATASTLLHWAAIWIRMSGCAPRASSRPDRSATIKAALDTR